MRESQSWIAVLAMLAMAGWALTVGAWPITLLLVVAAFVSRRGDVQDEPIHLVADQVVGGESRGCLSDLTGWLLTLLMLAVVAGCLLAVAGAQPGDIDAFFAELGGAP